MRTARTSLAVAICTAAALAITLHRYKAEQRPETFAWRRSAGATMDGEERLRVAVDAVRPDSGAEDARVGDMDIWAELFGQVRGGQLFVQGKGVRFHGASDVYVNKKNPYAMYFLEYNAWVSKMRALAFPTVPAFESGVRGIFCGSYKPDEGTVAFTVCDDVDAPNKRHVVRSFWRMLSTVVLMRALNERVKLTGVAHEVSKRSETQADAHAQAVESVVSKAAERMRRLVADLDSRMRENKARHALTMRKRRSEIDDVERSLRSRREEADALERELAVLKEKAMDGRDAVADSASRLERYNLKLASERMYLRQERARLARLRASARDMEQQWKARLSAAHNARERAMIGADEAKAREASIARRLADAREAARVATRDAAGEASSVNVDTSRVNALSAAAHEAVRRVKALEAERARLVARNDAIATSIESATAALGDVRGSAQSTSQQHVQQLGEVRTNEAARKFASENVERAKLEASVRTGKVVSSIDNSTISRETGRVHTKLADVLVRQQALLDAQYAALDRGKQKPSESSNPTETSKRKPYWERHHGWKPTFPMQTAYQKLKRWDSKRDNKLEQMCEAECWHTPGCKVAWAYNPKTGKSFCRLFSSDVPMIRESGIGKRHSVSKLHR